MPCHVGINTVAFNATCWRMHQLKLEILILTAEKSVRTHSEQTEDGSPLWKYPCAFG